MPRKDRRNELPLAGSACGCKTKAGGICTQPAMANGRCRMHGGKAAKGIKSGGFKHGRYSRAIKQLDVEIADRVEDPRLVDPRRSIAIQEGALARLREILDEKDSPEFRERVKGRVHEVLEAMRKDEHVEAKALLSALMGYVQRGVDESRALTALSDAAEQLNRAQTRYWQTAMSASRAIAPEEFLGFMFQLANVIEDEVDANAARRILERADRKLCGGALGLSPQEAPRAPRTVESE